MELAETNLGEFIKENRKKISREWEAVLHADGIALQDGALLEFTPHVEGLLEAIVQDTQKEAIFGDKPAPDMPALALCAERYAVEHLTAGLTQVQLVMTLQALRTIVLRLWLEHLEKIGVPAMEEMLLLDRAFANALTASLEHYGYLRSRCEALFLRMLAHDLRNALGALELMPSLLQRENTPFPDKLQKIASSISRSVESTVRIIGKISDFGSVHEGIGIVINPTRVDAGALCEEVLEGLRLRFPDHAILFENMGPFTGLFDRRRITQVFTNLIGNALRHGLRSEPVIVKMHTEMDELVFSVWNLCNPVTQEETGLMLNPMHRYAAQILSSRDPVSSLGIGLYISQEITQAHGGTISATAGENWISFEARLPLLRPNTGMQ